MPDFTSTAMVTVVVAVGSAEAARVAKKEPMNMSPVIGGFLLGVFLFAFGMISESVATKFCVLIIVASLLVNGLPFFQMLGTKPAK